MRTAINYLSFLLFFCFSNTPVHAQKETMTIDKVIILSEKNYPLLKKYDLVEKSTLYTLDNLSSSFLPQLMISGQASYQSETIDFSNLGAGQPGLHFPVISKDQYRIQAEINQQIIDGGLMRNRKEMAIANKDIRHQQFTVALHQVKERVTDIYFSILLFQEQLVENGLRKSDLQSLLQKAEAAYENGTGYRSSVDELKASIIKVDMNSTELEAARQSFMSMLALFTGIPGDSSTLFIVPSDTLHGATIQRPELKLFDLQKMAIDLQEKRLGIDLRPKLGAFVQAGYGRPTLNFVRNESGEWWMTGIRLNWTFGGLYTLKNDRLILKLNQEEMETDRDIFLFNTRLELSRNQAEIDKYKKLVEQDEEIIRLLGSVLESAKAQLDNGVITTHEYISKMNEENRARQTRIFHRIKLLQAYYDSRNISGN